MSLQIDIPYDAIRAFCQKYPIRRLSLFGSVLRDDFGPDSDIDVLVEFKPNAPVTYFDIAGMQEELKDVFGREIDLGTPESLKTLFREKVLGQALEIYEQQ
jgi:uncharacterized protein